MSSALREKNRIFIIKNAKGINDNLWNAIFDMIGEMDITEKNIENNRRVVVKFGKRPVAITFVSQNLNKIFYDNLKFTQKILEMKDDR